MSDPKCLICGERLRGYKIGQLCDGCQLDSFIPHWYEDAEQYKRREADGMLYATAHPRTGRDILDCPSGQRLRDTLRVGKSPRRGA